MDLIEKQKKYDNLIDSILESKKTIIKCAWDIGVNLKEIKERELYLLDCRNFDQFLEERVKVERSTAYHCISIVRDYQWKDFERWGYKKLITVKSLIKEEEGRRDFVKRTNVVPVRQLPEEVIDYQVSRGIKEITRFTDQISSKPNINTIEERKLRLKREYSVVEEHCDSVLDIIKNELITWISQAKKHSNDIEIGKLLVKAELRLKKLE